MQSEIYFDNSATTRQYDEVTELIADTAKYVFGNPSSLHRKGIEAEKVIRSAREHIAESLGAQCKNIYFTSGGTESNNLAIIGYLDANTRKGKHIITSQIEHPSVLEVYRHLEKNGYRTDYIEVDEYGKLNIDQLREKICPETALISVALVNSETGTIQQMEQIAAVRDSVNPNTCIHADAIQAYGKIRIDPVKSGIDMLSLSSHKIHGPKGIGALYVSDKVKINPLFYGGGQESLLRSGTENVPGIAGFGLASRIAFEKFEENFEKVYALKEEFIKRLSETDIIHRVLSPEDGSPYILNIAFQDVRAEVLLHHLEERGIYVSAGSACSSRKSIRSHVLTAMKVPVQLIDGALRFSFSGLNTFEEVSVTVEAIKEIVPKIKVSRKHKFRRTT